MLDLVFLSGEQISRAIRILAFALSKCLLLNLLIAFFNLNQGHFFSRPDDLRRCHWANQLQPMLKLVTHVDAPKHSWSRLWVPVSSLYILYNLFSRRKLGLQLLTFFLTNSIRVVDFVLDVIFTITDLGNFGLGRLIGSLSHQKSIAAAVALFRVREFSFREAVI